MKNRFITQCEDYYHVWNLQSQIKSIQNVEFGDAIPSHKYFSTYYPTYTKYYGIFLIVFICMIMYLINNQVLIPMKTYNDISNIQKVSINLYLEACCPNTQDFIVNSLAPAWDTPGFNDITNITVSPWGKQTFYYNKSTQIYHYTCQHGNNECIGQQLESCIIHLYPNSTQYIPFIIDLEAEMKNIECRNSTHCTCNIVELAKGLITQTVKHFGMDWNDIYECINNVTEIDSVEMQQAAFTLKTDLNYVPWITVNGMHTVQIQSQCQHSLLNCVCQMFKQKNILYDQVCGDKYLI